MANINRIQLASPLSGKHVEAHVLPFLLSLPGVLLRSGPTSTKSLYTTWTHVLEMEEVKQALRCKEARNRLPSPDIGLCSCNASPASNILLLPEHILVTMLRFPSSCHSQRVECQRVVDMAIPKFVESAREKSTESKSGQQVPIDVMAHASAKKRASW
jgi:hypothetical protein